MGRMREIKSVYWSQSIPEGGYDTNGNLLVYRQNDFEELEQSHRYDALNHLTEEQGHFRQDSRDSNGLDP